MQIERKSIKLNIIEGYMLEFFHKLKKDKVQCTLLSDEIIGNPPQHKLCVLRVIRDKSHDQFVSK